MTQDFPALQPNQYALLQVDLATGIVLTITGEWAIGAAERYLIFHSFAELESFAQTQIHAHPMIECAAFSLDGKCIKVFRNDTAIQACSTARRRQ
jgi:hypothetical protein